MSVLSAFLSLSVPFKLGLFLIAVFILTASYKTLIYILSKKTQGTIVSLSSSRGNKGGTVYYPIFKYITEDGQELTAAGSVGSNPPRYSIGQQVPIHYIRFAPRHAKISTFQYMFFTELIIGAIGSLLLVIGLLDMFGVLEFLDQIGLIDIRK